MEGQPATTAENIGPGTFTSVEQVRHYRDTHRLGLQYITGSTIEIGTPEFFKHIRPLPSSSPKERTCPAPGIRAVGDGSAASCRVRLNQLRGDVR
jgi:hypothetical protein